MKTLIFLSILLSVNLQSMTNNKVSKIIVVGNKKTKKKIILNESNFQLGDVITKSKLEEAKRRLLNLLIFSTVKVSSKGSVVKIDVKERWTTIPILKFSSGGGVSELILGVFDVNLFGNYVESGLQYQRLGDKNSGVFWTKIPRLTKKLGLELQAWKFNRIRVKYDQNIDDPLVTNGFTQKRDKIFFSTSYRKNYETELKFHYEYNHDRFANDLEFDNFSNQNVVLPNNTTFHFFGTSLLLGKINNDLEFHEGNELLTTYRYGVSESSKNFHEASLKLTNFLKFNKIFNWGTRFFFGYNNSDDIHHLFYFGGLDSVRGFADNRFSGATGFYINNEVRTSLLRKKSFILQLNKFVDIANAKKEIKNIVNNPVVSVGVGFRVVLPKFYRFVVRFDYAKPLLKNDDNSISFGVQQFF